MHPFRAIALKLGSVAAFVAMASLIKAASVEVPPGQAVFFRSLFALPVIGRWLWAIGDLPGGLRTRRPQAHLWRGVIGTCAMALGFAGLGLLPLPEVTAIGFAAPVLVVILAALVLGERLRLFRVLAVLFGLGGVLIVIWPNLSLLRGGGSSTASLGAMLVLGSACAAAIAQITVRTMVRTESTAAIVFYFSITATCLSLLTSPFGWVWPDLTVVVMLAFAGLLGGTGQICLTSAYRFADVSVIAPFEYASIVLAILSGYVFFTEVPTLRTLAGSAIVICAGIIIIWREAQLGLVRGKARPNMTPGDR